MSKIYKYTLTKEHIRGLDKLKAYYNQKIRTSNSLSDKKRIESNLYFLEEMNYQKEYTTSNKIRLNYMRDEYLKNDPFNLIVTNRR